MKNKEHVIVNVIEDSIAGELMISPGDVLLSVNGENIEDVFDYRFMIRDGNIELLIRKKDGEEIIYDIDKDPDEDLGLEFDEGLMDGYRSCCNKCVFCFIDQMPKGMRETLYFKDDDSRLSFLQGNYITLTNMNKSDIERIIRYHMSPINISVHSTDPDLRCMMLGNRFAGKKLEFIDDLFAAGINMNAQIVLCKGINDGENLKRTISDLSRYAPVMQSVSVVPSGLTRFRDGLFPLKPIEKTDAADAVSVIEAFQKDFYRKYSSHFVHASDELYLTAGLDVPEEERYDGYLQLENGVGMIRLLREEFYEALEERCSASCAKKCPVSRHLTIATGQLAADEIRTLTEDAVKRMMEAGVFEHSPVINCIAVKNNFFGDTITVSGLICGCDIIEQLNGQDLGDELLLPINMMRSGERYFLDDVTVDEVSEKLKVRVTIVPQGGKALLNAICGDKNEIGGRQIYEQADSSDSWKA